MPKVAQRDLQKAALRDDWLVELTAVSMAQRLVAWWAERRDSPMVEYLEQR